MKMMFSLGWVIILNSVSLQAESQAQKRQAQFKQLYPLKKVTVGPQDNYQPVALDAQTLFFTRNQSFSSQLFKQDLHSGVVTELGEGSFDTKDLSVFEDRYAWISFQKDARGDVCFGRDFKQFECISKPDSTERSPLWISDDRLVFSTFDVRSGMFKLIEFDTKKKLEKFLADAHSPNAYKGNLVYVNAKGQLVINGEQRSFDLPGVAGFPRYSPDGEYVYFSQFMADSNLDGRIDGSDHGVVFRIKISSKQQALPEQLSSIKDNCSYPYPTSERLYLSCAQGGSLDVYAIELSGQVPESWTEADFEEVYKSARRYEDRIMILNVMRSRMPKEQHYNRLFVNHLHLKQVEASLYYFYKSEYKSQQSIELILTTQMDPKNDLSKRQKLRSFIEQANTPKMARLYFLDSLGNERLFVSLKNEIRSSLDKYSILELYVFSELLAKRQKNSEDFLALANHEAFAMESRLYFALQALARSADVDQRRKIAQSLRLEILGEAELIAIDIALQKDAKAKQESYKKLDTLMNTHRSEYFLMRAIYHRALANLQDSMTQYEYVASTWLRYTKREEAEFIYARMGYGNLILNKAFAYLEAGNHNFAKGQFFSAVNLTDLSEAHYGYIEASLVVDGEGAVRQQYEKWAERSAASQLAYAEALLLTTTNNLEKAQSVLGSINDMRDPAHFLLAGYIELELMLRAMTDASYDITGAEKAHRFFVLCLDSGNERERAAALDNLGILHFVTGKYGLAVDYYAERDALGFVNDSERKAFSWNYARALYYTYRYQAAFQVLKNAEKYFASSEDQSMFYERLGFYALFAGLYKECDEAYKKTLDSKKLDPTLDHKVRMGRAVALSHLNKKKKEAIEWIDQVYAANSSSSKDKRILLGLKAQILEDQTVELLKARLAEFAGDLEEPGIRYYKIKTLLQIAYNQSRQKESAATLIPTMNQALSESQTLAEKAGSYLDQSIFETLKACSALKEDYGQSVCDEAAFARIKANALKESLGQRYDEIESL
jgi:cellulose synthase operon protein C